MSTVLQCIHLWINLQHLCTALQKSKATVIKLGEGILTVWRQQQGNYEETGNSLLVFLHFSFQQVDIGIQRSKAMREITLHQPCKFINGAMDDKQVDIKTSLLIDNCKHSVNTWNWKVKKNVIYYDKTQHVTFFLYVWILFENASTVQHSQSNIFHTLSLSLMGKGRM